MKYSYLIFGLLLLNSCVSVRFPKELTVNVSLPEHTTPHQVDAIMDQVFEFSTDSLLQLPSKMMFWNSSDSNTFDILADSIHGPHKRMKIIRLNGQSNGTQKNMKVIVKIDKDSLSLDEN